MYCKNCGAKMNENQAICLKCGVEAGTGNAYCPNCGKTVAEGAAVCLNCGISLKDEKTASKASDAKYLNGQDKNTMAITCFFLGAFGVHNFIMGETKRGITKIICTFLCGIGGILALIDFIKILSGSYVVEVTKKA